MELNTREQLLPFIELVDAYNRSFYERDIKAFESLHIKDNDFVFFDNHAGCDSASYSEHERKVREFFENGNVSQLSKENVRVFKTGDMACITLVLRYGHTPQPGVRSTYVVERVEGAWRIRHMHHSFDPNEIEDTVR